MIPIFEQDAGRGIGYNVRDFLRRFDDICREHIASERAQAFAFIFYDFTSRDIREILKDQGAFAKLDRLAGTTLSIFYLHSGVRRTVERFNAAFLEKLGVVDAAFPPCIVFFKLKDGEIKDVAVAQLNSDDLVNGFHELYKAIERYVEDASKVGHGLRSIRWLKSGGAAVSIVVLKEALQKLAEILF